MIVVTAATGQYGRLVVDAKIAHGNAERIFRIGRPPEAEAQTASPGIVDREKCGRERRQEPLPSQAQRLAARSPGSMVSGPAKRSAGGPDRSAAPPLQSSGTSSSATMLMILISGLIAGPAVSL